MTFIRTLKRLISRVGRLNDDGNIFTRDMKEGPETERDYLGNNIFLLPRVGYGGRFRDGE